MAVSPHRCQGGVHARVAIIQHSGQAAGGRLSPRPFLELCRSSSRSSSYSGSGSSRSRSRSSSYSSYSSRSSRHSSFSGSRSRYVPAAQQLQWMWAPLGATHSV